jgi:hypothetical protein
MPLTNLFIMLYQENRLNKILMYFESVLLQNYGRTTPNNVFLSANATF